MEKPVIHVYPLMDIPYNKNLPASQRPSVIILMGLPAAGKSTFYARELAPRGIEHINLDTLRTRNRELLQIQEYLKRGVSFAVDNTNTLPAERAGISNLPQMQATG